MRVLLTGGSGQLGRCLIERVAGRSDIELIAPDRAQFDLEQPGALGETIGAISPDVVINAAAFTAVDQAEDEPERAQVINAESAGVIAAAARTAGARMIHISTDYVFDGSAGDAYREEAPTNPLGVYGRTKCIGERRVRAEAPDHLIVRTAWLYSPFGKNFVRTMIDLANSRKTVSVVADQYGSPTSASDLSDGLIAVLEAWRGGNRTGLGRTYHLAGTGVTSWCSFAEAIFERCREAGLPAAKVVAITTAEWPTRASRPRNSALDSSRFATDFGYRAPLWQDSLNAVVARLGNSADAA